MVKKVIKIKKGFFLSDIEQNFKNDSQTFIFSKIGTLGRILRTKDRRIVRNPKGFEVSITENHTPKINHITITYQKKKKRKN